MRKYLGRFSHLAITALGVCAFALSFEREARATDATEFPDNGSEQGMRGGAWVARASDPLASFYNPAGLAGQPTRVVLQSNFSSQRTCFTRIKAKNDSTADGVMPGGSYPQACDSAGYAVDPQLAMTIRLTKRIGLGIAPLMAPSAANGNSSYPEFATVGKTPNSPEPGRYLLTGQNVLLVTPTIGIGAEVLDRLRVGASFQWGIATFSFTSASYTQNMAMATSSNDLKGTLSGHDLFIPGFTLGTIYSPTDYLDIAAWYKWSAPLDASGDVQTAYPYYSATASGMASTIANTDTSKPNCGFEPAGSDKCGNGGNARFHLSRPMEAKIGIRYHMPRHGIPYDEHMRDPMAQDVFDVELDGTWANDSTMDFIYIRFPSSGNPPIGTLPVNLGGGGLTSVVPPNADIPLHYSDVFGIRFGGDWNVLPDQLAIRGGTFYQSPAQTAANQIYQSLAFAADWMVGLALGGTYRIHLGPGQNALELSAGYEHVFVGTEDQGGGIYALAGTPCVMGLTASGSCMGTNSQQQTPERYRTPWSVNNGTITNSINVINAGLGYRF
jgi:long-subunit fatty acid transport protein